MRSFGGELFLFSDDFIQVNHTHFDRWVWVTSLLNTHNIHIYTHINKTDCYRNIIRHGAMF